MLYADCRGSEMLKQRNQNIDILRILAMYLIIVGHFLIYREDGLLIAKEGQSIIGCIGDYASVVMMGFSIVGTNLFFLISGFFGIRFRLSKFAEIILITYLYGGLIELFLLLSGEIGVGTFLFCMVVLLEKYWFIEVYLVLMIASIILNSFVQNATQKQYDAVVVLGFLLLCFYGYVHDCTRIGVSQGFSVVWASYLYLIGARIRTININKGIIKLLYWGGTISFVLASIGIAAIGKWELFWKFEIAYNNPLVLISSVGLFLLFSTSKEVERSAMANKMTRWLAGATIGVYLIHIAPNLNLFQRVSVLPRLDSVFGIICFVIYVLVGAIIVYLVCALIDILRQFTLSKLFALCFTKIECFFSHQSQSR